MKYRLKGASGEPVDKTIADSWRRIARALAAAETDAATRKSVESRFFGALAYFRFLPDGRIQAGAGSERNATLFHCFALATIPADLGDITDHLREAAPTMHPGDGLGYEHLHPHQQR